nr:hypothetical protein [Tanacetum cinerariifolium]
MKSLCLDVKTTSSDTALKFLSGFQSSIFLEIRLLSCVHAETVCRVGGFPFKVRVYMGDGRRMGFSHGYFDRFRHQISTQRCIWLDMKPRGRPE